jgi:hypothetical protein
MNPHGRFIAHAEKEGQARFNNDVQSIFNVGRRVGVEAQFSYGKVEPVPVVPIAGYWTVPGPVFQQAVHPVSMLNQIV